MDKQKIIIESLAMDLKRVALGLYRGSTQMANKFKQEALKREEELEKLEVNGYLKKLIKGSRESLEKESGAAEDILMYSTLFQNYSLKNF